MQRGFPTNRQPRWLALYGYLQFNWAVGISFGITITSLAGTHFFLQKRGWLYQKRGLVPPFPLKKGASAPFWGKKGVPAKKMIPKCTDQDFLWYW
jgi:hypothetical protein